MIFNLQEMNLETMTEADVRETIVRPFLHALGYRQGSLTARIETEKKLIYSKQFLGHKNPKKDPELRGRADYICSVVSYGCWIVEVKSPKSPLGIEDSNQAHTYAAHPEVAAIFSLLTNGREFRLYKTSNPSTPLFKWPAEDTEKHFLMLSNLLDPAAIKKLTTIPIDLGTPLAAGWNSSAQIVGGYLTYEKQSSSNPLIQSSDSIVLGTQAAVSGKEVFRNEDGRIQAVVSVRAPFIEWDRVNKIAGIEEFSFTTPDRFVSTDIESPTIFQNQISSTLPAGTRMKILPSNEFVLPQRMTMNIGTEVIGFLKDNVFLGIFSNNYLVWMLNGDAPINFEETPPTFDLKVEGRFEIKLQ